MNSSKLDRPILISVAQYLERLESGRLGILDIIQRANQLSVDGVELRREPWSAYKTELPTVRARVEASHMIVVFATFSTLFNKDDAAHSLLLHDIDTAYALGSPFLRVFPGEVTSDDTAGWEKAKQAVEHAASLGIQIALENYSGSPGGTLAEITHILGQIESPALKTNIDIGNYPLHDQDVVEAIEIIGDRVIYAHLKDCTGVPGDPPVALGEGILPLGQILTALDNLPQRIVYCFEFPGSDDPDRRIEKSVAFLRGYRDKRS